MSELILPDNSEFGEALDSSLLGFPVDDPETIVPDVGEGPEPALAILELEAEPLGVSASGLSAEHRAAAKSASVAAARVALEKRDRVHYTQDARRWDGIDNGRFARRGDFPRYADCSAFTTWCTYQGVRFYNLRDVVNGQNWLAGYTGTQLTHGKRVVHVSNLERGDFVLYGRPGSTGAHVALYVGGGLVISHGSEGGPYLLPYDYRSDVMQFRRYI